MAQGVCPTLHMESYFSRTGVNCISTVYITEHRAGAGANLNEPGVVRGVSGCRQIRPVCTRATVPLLLLLLPLRLRVCLGIRIRVDGSWVSMP